MFEEKITCVSEGCIAEDCLTTMPQKASPETCQLTNEGVFSKFMEALAAGGVVNIPLELLETSAQIRDCHEGHVGEISINAIDFGIMENILVCPDTEKQKFIVREGNQRVSAALELGLETIPAKLLSEEAPNMALLANKIVRLEHSSIELAHLCKAAMDEGFSQKDLVERFHVHKSKMCELIKIATELPASIQEAAKAEPKKFNHSTLLKLAKLSGDEQQAAFDNIMNRQKQKSARFSSITKALDSQKLVKKKLSVEDMAQLVDTLETIVRALSNREYHEAPATDMAELHDRVKGILQTFEAYQVHAVPASSGEQPVSTDTPDTDQALVDTVMPDDSVNNSAERAA